MSKEHSAGMVVFAGSSIDANPGDRQYLLLDTGQFWDFPKGHVERGESNLEAAYRELFEEAALDHVSLVNGFSRQIRYFFRKRSVLVEKTVIYFLAWTADMNVKISHEHTGYAFLAFDKAMERLTYPNSREILRAAHHFNPTTII